MRCLIAIIIVACLAGCGEGPTTVPDAPLYLTANNTASKTVRLNWEKSKTASGYNIYMKSAQTQYQIIGNADSSPYDVKNLINGTAYSFKVLAVNAIGESPPSQEVFSVPDIVIYNPYQPKQQQYKGSTHIHTSNSDGRNSPWEVVAAYKNKGFDFIAITDHDFITTSDYDPGILIINGVEETSDFGHIITLKPWADQDSHDTQTILDETERAGGLAILAHPNYSIANYTIEELMMLNNYKAIEIFNQVAEYEEKNGNAEEKWDAVLSKGKLVYGVASDDMHSLDATKGFNKGWINVFADTLTENDIVASMGAGNYYASTGPTLDVSFAGMNLAITTNSPAKVEFITKNGYVKRTDISVLSASYTVTGDEGYVRVRVTRDSDGKKAWTNPIYIY